MKSRTGSSNGPGGSGISPSTIIHQGGTVNNSNSPTTMERHGGGGGGGSSSSSGRLRLHHKRRPGHRRNTQHNVATVEPICDLRKVVNGIVTVDQDKLKKLVQQDPIDVHYAVEEEPFARLVASTMHILISKHRCGILYTCNKKPSNVCILTAIYLQNYIPRLFLGRSSRLSSIYCVQVLVNIRFFKDLFIALKSM